MRARSGLVITFLLAGLLTGGRSSGAEMMASFFDMFDTKFSVKVVAPRETVREYAICKAVWFAEKKKVAHIALSNPVYAPPNASSPLTATLPDDWVSLETTAYFEAPSPDGNPTFTVAEKAHWCRKGWDWYH